MKHLILSILLCATICFGINIDAGASSECNRKCLAGFMDTYLKALVAKDPSRLPVTKNIKYTENGVRLNLGDGLWQTASAMPTYRLDVIDEEAGQVALLGKIDENGNNNFLAVRLKVEKGQKVSEIENMIARYPMMGEMPDLGFPTVVNKEIHPLMMQEIPRNKRMSRAELIRIGNSYFTGLDTDNSAANVSFDPECQRRESGIITANNPQAEKGSMVWMGCASQFDTGFSVIVTDIRERRFIADPVTGQAFAMGFFDHDGIVNESATQPYSIYIGESFKIMDGKIRQIEAVMLAVPYAMESGW
ncbi:MAG: hypothetical protein PVG39_20940 [Desulfobacteraceae bacterium]|jgi:hypothetical protein